MTHLEEYSTKYKWSLNSGENSCDYLSPYTFMRCLNYFSYYFYNEEKYNIAIIILNKRSNNPENEFIIIM